MKPLDPSIVPDEISTSARFSRYFEDCIGAIDGSLFPAHIPYLAQGPWRSRKGLPAQNVFAACSFDLKFTAVHAGWEGSAHDVTVLKDALVKKRFRPTPGKYYLADAGYYNCEFMIVPYEKVRYHLREWKLSGLEPLNKEELFNLRHAALRNAIERIFGVLKRKWKILKKPSEFPIGVQVKLILALTAVHNFIKLAGCDDDEEFCFNEPEELRIAEERAAMEGEEAPLPAQTIAQMRVVTAKWNKKRDEIAQKMWDDFVS